MMNKIQSTLKLIAMAFGLFLFSRCSEPPENVHSATTTINETHESKLLTEKQKEEALIDIRNVMIAQEMAWNTGSLEDFMEGYWKSEELKFIGKSGLKKGWLRTLNNYKKSYPNREAMGILKFDLIDMELLDPEHAFVLGEWHLQLKDEKVGGHYSLLWRKIDGEWLIVTDHSS
jgi:hypothetical protein